MIKGRNRFLTVVFTIVMCCLICVVGYSEKSAAISKGQGSNERMNGIPSLITIEGGKFAYVAKGKNITLKATDQSGQNMAISWESEDPEIAKVSDDGVVTGKKAGRTLIFVTGKSDTTKYSTAISVTVHEEAVQSITINNARKEIGMDEHLSLDVSVTPYTACTFVKWESGDSSVATVDEDGYVTPVSTGTVKITAKAVDGSGKKKSITLRVTDESKKKKEEESSEKKQEEEEASVERKIKEIVKSVTRSGMSEREKAKALHDWIIDHAEYDYSFRKYTAKELLFEGTGVCEAYMDTYRRMLDEAGIVNETIIGKGNGASHGWNVIRIDGQWYHVDCTWDDTSRIRYKYFMVSEQAIRQDHSFDCSYQGDYEFIFNDKTAKVNRCYSSAASVTIPKSVQINGKTYKVTEIGSSAFSKLKNIVSVTIPSGIVTIGSSAFSNCQKLKSVKIPSTVKTIEDGVFWGCKKLTSITIPDSVTSIGLVCFKDCTALKSVRLPKKVKNFEDLMFSGCTSLTDVKLPSGITQIGSRTFLHCKNLKKVEIPEGVTSIEKYAFYDCPKLQKLKLPASLREVKEYAFGECGKLRIDIPENVKVDRNAFSSDSWVDWGS